MVTFGMGISIPNEELDLCHKLANTAYLNLGLTNDLYSWQKEYETAVTMGQDYVVNIISVLMEEHSISEEEAKAICRQKIRVTIADFRKIVEDTNKRTDVSVDLKKYLEALLYSLSGNLIWSLECPRYHRWASYNERQLGWMKNGIPKTDKISTNGAVRHEQDSPEPRTTKINGTCTNAAPTSESANGLNGFQTLKGDESSSSGIINTSLVNVFATKKIGGSNGVKPQDKNTTPPCAGVERRQNVTLERDIVDLDTKVKA